MTIYTAHFYTEADWASRAVEADTPEQALELARQIADGDAFWELDFQSYDDTSGVEHIEVWDAGRRTVAEWRHSELLLRLAATDLLQALEQAVGALNTAPRFAVPGLDADSYAIAALCDQAIARAKGGVQ